MRENPVKNLLKAGKPAIGTWLTLGDPLATETLAHLDFDWLNVDMEHGSIDVRETRALFQVINTTDVVPTARVPWNDHVWIKRVLDAGAYGVVVPMVRTREEAERAVAACRYPPAGIRSIGSGRNHYAFRGSQADYLARANDELLV
ncbi:MAG: 2-dehydro-3-deoxyglucarate aldolase, partial [Chloroflexi bacterium]|nr:2-dehydro-3-deoxyglucarate aldolase [Chloroflexota bacterium]